MGQKLNFVLGAFILMATSYTLQADLNSPSETSTHLGHHVEVLSAPGTLHAEELRAIPEHHHNAKRNIPVIEPELQGELFNGPIFGQPNLTETTEEY